MCSYTNKKNLLLVIVLAFYLWTMPSLEFKLRSSDYYNFITTSFLHKHVYLEITPSDKFLSLSDYYDPYKRGGYNDKVHDLSFYKGKFYFPYGIAPVLTLFLPYRLLFGKPLFEGIACLIFIFGAFLFSMKIVENIRNEYFKEVPEWMLILSYLTLAICNVGPYILRGEVPWFYGVAITSGSFFLTGGLYFFFQSLKNKANKNIFLTSLFICLAFCSRFHFIFSIWLLLYLLKYLYDENKSLLNKKYLYVVMPVIITLGLLAYYNYSRFNSIFDFGSKYQIGLINYMKISPIGLNNISENVYLYLLRPVKFLSQFPFVEAPFWAPAIVEKKWQYERMAGIFYAFPFVFILLGFFPFFVFKGIEKFPKVEFKVLSLITIQNLSILLLYHYQTFRYYMDFIFVLIILSVISWFSIYVELVNKKKPYKKFLFISTVLLLISIVFSFAFSIKGQLLGLESQNPHLFNSIVRFFN